MSLQGHGPLSAFVCLGTSRRQVLEQVPPIYSTRTVPTRCMRRFQDGFWRRGAGRKQLITQEGARKAVANADVGSRRETGSSAKIWRVQWRPPILGCANAVICGPQMLRTRANTAT